MKSPIWIINSFLVLLLVIVFSLLFFSKVDVPKFVSLRNIVAEEHPANAHQPLNEGFLKTIYEENDLFNTYIAKPHIDTSPKSVQIAPPPTPPTAKQPTPLAPPVIHFMDPLQITLTGIIMSTQDSENRVIIADNATKEEKLYKIGDKIADAYILRIFKNKIILLRSNGQQETLFMNAEEAQAEINRLQKPTWSAVVQQVTPVHYLVNPLTFIQQIQGLPHFIDMLDLTTVFHKGRSVGTRVGKMKENSIGYALGFKPGDIIIMINGTPTTTTAQRITIYHQILSAQIGSGITVEFIREKNRIKQLYTLSSNLSVEPLQPFAALPQEVKTTPLGKAPNAFGTPNRNAILDKKQRTSPAVNNLKKREKQSMKKFGNRSSFIQSIPQ